MTWRHPHILWWAVALGGLICLYLAALRRSRPRTTVRFHAHPVTEAAAAAGRGRRHLAAGSFAIGLAAIIVAAAGPIAPLPTPTGTPVVLIIDISRSMEETDIAPSRIEAAKAAAVEFVRHLPKASRIALVSFGSFVTVVVPLTDDRARIIDGITNLTTQLRTQLGTGLLEGVRAVTGEGPLPPLAGGIRAAAVLLTDGRASDGIPPADAAQEAQRRGVRVYTVGLGTAADPSTFRSGIWGVLDEPTLRMIAGDTGGRYYRADEAGRLRDIYRDLATAIGWTRRPTEVSAIAAAAALVLLAAAVALRIKFAPLG